MIMHRPDPSAVIRALRGATPYIRLFKGKTFVVKAGGGVFGDPQATRNIIEQIAILHSLGVRVVFVHGGGPQLTEVTEKLGVPTQMKMTSASLYARVLSVVNSRRPASAFRCLMLTSSYSTRIRKMPTSRTALKQPTSLWLKASRRSMRC